MLEILFNVYNLKDYFNENSFELYIVGNNGIYYYWFVDVQNTKTYTLNEIRSNDFREKVSILIDPDKCFPYKNKDKIFLSFNWKKVLSMLNRTYNRDIIELKTKPFKIDWFDFFNFILS